MTPDDSAKIFYLEEQVEYLIARIKNENTLVRNCIICCVLFFLAGIVVGVWII